VPKAQVTEEKKREESHRLIGKIEVRLSISEFRINIENEVFNLLLYELINSQSILSAI